MKLIFYICMLCVVQLSLANVDIRYNRYNATIQRSVEFFTRMRGKVCDKETITAEQLANVRKCESTQFHDDHFKQILDALMKAKSECIKELESKTSEYTAITDDADKALIVTYCATNELIKCSNKKLKPFLEEWRKDHPNDFQATKMECELKAVGAEPIKTNSTDETEELSE